jgi:hypothetical protein
MSSSRTQPSVSMHTSSIYTDHSHTIFTVQLVYPETTLYQALPGARCCHVCTPRLFPLEVISIEKLPGLKRGKKRKLSEGQENAIREGLRDWREDVLLDAMYPGTSSISAETVLGNDVIEALATCGERIDSHAEMRRHVRWAMGYDSNTGLSTLHGDMLLNKLQAIYMEFDEDVAADEAHLAELRTDPPSILPSSFYTSSTQTYTQHSAASSNSIQTHDLDSLGQASSTVLGRTGASQVGRPRGSRRAAVRDAVVRGAGRVGRPRGNRALQTVRSRGAQAPASRPARASRGDARARRGRGQV